ncbi:MAG: O-methyltransferase [Bacteroidota bacterium]
MDFIDEKLLDYAEKHTTAETALLSELNRDTHAHILSPRMLSGHLQGRLLAMLSRMIKPQYILEIGTYTGYSAICLSEGLQQHGKLTTIDINEELQDMIKSYFDKAGLGHQIEHITGDALEIIPKLETNFDLVFIDADKINYSNYYDLVMPRLNKGGYILADNVLWSGNVLKPFSEQDDDTRAIVAFNEKVAEDKRVENILLPIRDGIMMIRKL